MENEYKAFKNRICKVMSTQKYYNSNKLIKNVVVEKNVDNKYYISVLVESLDVKNNK